MYTHAIPADGRVTALADAYRVAQAREKAAAELKASLANDLKVLAEQARASLGLDPENTRVVFEGQTRVTVTPVESWRVDTARMKREAPETYVMYAKRAVTSRLSIGEGDD